MTASIGALVVSLGLDATEFITGMTKSEKEAKAFAAQIDAGLTRAASAAGVALGAIAVGAVGAYGALRALVGSAADFKDLEEKTGASAESLAALSVAAAVGGTEITTVAAAMNKLTKSLVGVDDESKAAGAALGALGLNVKTFKQLDPATQFETLADALDKFKDNTQKTAVAQALLGKSGAELLPFLKELNAEGGRSVILTQKQIELADDYADKQTKLKATVALYAQSLATDVLPSIIDFENALKDTALELLGIDKSAKTLGSNQAIKDFADGAVEALGFVVDQVDLISRLFVLAGQSIAGYAAVSAQLLQGNLAQAKAAGEAAREEINKTIERETFGDKLRKQINARRIAEQNAASYSNEGRNGSKPSLDFNGEQDGALAKAAFEKQTKALERALKEQQDLIQARNKFLDLYNGQNLLSIQAYYDARRVVEEQGLAAQLTIYDKEIAAAQALRAASTKDTDRIAAESKIDDLRSKRADVIQKSGLAGIELTVKQKAAEEDLQKSFNATIASVAELQGELARAAAIRFDAQNDSLRKTFTANDEQAGLAALDALRERTIQQAKFNEEAQKSSLVLGDLQTAEARIALAQQAGSVGELQALKLVGDARAAAIAQLEAQVEAQEAVARASESPQLIANADKARLALQQLKATVDPLAQAVNDSLGHAFEDTLDKLQDGTLKASDVFKSFANSIIRDILRIEQQNLIKSLFGGSGGVGGLVSSFFGSSGGSGFGTGSNYGNQDYGTFLAEGTNNVPYDGFRAILHKGESVTPAKYNPAVGGAGGGGNVVIENHGAQVTTRKDSNGDTRVLVNAMKAELLEDMSRGGQFSRGMTSTYGLRRDLPRRGT